MKKSALYSASVLLSCVSTVALAQEATPLPPAGATAPVEGAANSANDGLEDIVVTATRREERLQDIPVTVTALTKNSIAAAGVVDIRGLTQVVPGFFGGKNLGLFLPVIRGVGTSSVSAADEANVATYIDGVYQPDPFSTFIDLAEIERIEVLRGPQGTVFGRNATGGLINVITPDPAFETSGNISGRLGRLRNDAMDYDLRGYVTTGLSDKVAMNVSGLYRKTEDYITDLVRGGEVGGIRVANVRGKLLFAPSDSAQIILTGEYTDQKSSTNALQPINGNTAGRRFPGVILPTGPWQSATDVKPVLNFERYNLALRTKFEFGDVNLETSTGYMHNATVQVTDSDSSNIRLGLVAADAPNITSESISQEVRLLSANPGRFQWILGAYAFNLKASAGIRAISVPGGPGTPEGMTLFQPKLETTSYAGFGEGTYELVDSLFFTAGVRYTWEKREIAQRINGANILPGQKSFDKVTYRAALRYNFADDANIYASYGTGYKSGVFNYTSAARVPVAPETITSYEVGLKADPLSWLRTNLSVFYYDYKNLQAIARDATGTQFVLQNAGTAEIYGGELEVQAAVSDALKLRGSLAYTHANYTDFPRAQSFLPLPTGGNTIQTLDVAGNNMTRAPRLTMNMGFDWSQDVGGGKLALSGNVYRSSRVYFDFANRFSQKPYLTATAELAWTTADEAWRFSIWANNITNEKIYREIRTSGVSADATYEQPRKIGIGAAYKF